MFNQFAEAYGKTLDDSMKDREALYKIIHNLIERIIVYSRPATDLDVIKGGPKKDNQMIPYSIRIVMRTSSEIMTSLAKNSLEKEKKEFTQGGGAKLVRMNHKVLPHKLPMERNTGVEPASHPWEGCILPMY